MRKRIVISNNYNMYKQCSSGKGNTGTDYTD